MSQELTGRVVPGLGEGRRLGFPTANLEISIGVRPAPGVYIVLATIDNGVEQAGLLVSGVHWESPGVPRVEVYLIDFKGKLYGHQLAVMIIKKIRDLINTKDQQQLISRIEKDILDARAYFKSEYKG